MENSPVSRRNKASYEGLHERMEVVKLIRRRDISRVRPASIRDSAQTIVGLRGKLKFLVEVDWIAVEPLVTGSVHRLAPADLTA